MSDTDDQSSASSGDGPPVVADLRTLVALEAWANPRIRTKLKDDPSGAVAEIANRHSLDLPDVNFKVVFDGPDDYTLVIPENPVGKSPAEVRAERSGSPAELQKISGGGVCTVTAECGCSRTVTGACACLTIAGTACVCKVVAFTEALYCPDIP
ncbi:hypothetical protein [Mycobacterium seoulense]|uniref:hypothetical protein n=1 Tax=Mycobacterium seoulense TaxID=386911 RepID=UPI003CF08223